MSSDGVLRIALWVTAFANVAVGLSFAAPASALGPVVGLPAEVPALYRLLLGWTIALFGLMYGWLARQPEILRAAVAFGAIGKAGVGVIVVVLFARGAIPAPLAALISGDIGFALLFAWWLQASRSE